MITRRNFVAGLATLLAAPAIVRVGSLMQLRSTPLVVPLRDFLTLAEYAERMEPVWDKMVSSIFYGNDALDPASFHGINFHRATLLEPLEMYATPTRAELRQFALS